ncbi:unnamed protein product [Heligmosomoides polygyrus]|uniref:Phlebovirus_G2 domain-containing protein n=1 Tax=Heligmosomoides polygyrus TaxID=6339 RepID=A0A183G106_HELPZ|nr:unnamed protein product [Heligmosomoides polygyrus]
MHHPDSGLIGCYSCISGATVDLVCTSSEGEATALIQCPNQTQVAKCNTRGYMNKVILHFDINKVLVSCIISCPGGSTNVPIKGSLFYADDELI